MKKIFVALLLLLMLCSICSAEMTAIEKAYFKAKEPSSDDKVGFWKGFHKSIRKETINNNEECFVMLPAPEDRPEWDYVIIALEQYYSQKPGNIVALLRKTEHSNIYLAKMVMSTDPTQTPIFMPVIYSDEGYFDFRGHSTYDLVLIGFVHFLIKIDDHVIPEIEEKYPKPKDESWRELLAPVVN